MIDKIVLIDDDEITLMICELVIKAEKFASEVLMFKNGREGIDYFEKLEIELKEGHPDKVPELVLLDLNMPVMNGWEFLEHFSNRCAASFPEVKICILSSSVDPLDITTSTIYHNVIGFINKPLTIERVNELKDNAELAQYFDFS
ncbi:response regulator [Botryobacter ruber]|uniref:response regulator n=1 Tax=Botryobacter ruber TaxID=2171629 RepID=UPI000E0C1E29|nr:response regulator [Botryobacter ruber]